ncbi:MAG TPA: rhomboid family intramembrane serine protease [Pirellulales bacterium]|nr:rhomboid family intramembrane serine protease [Pirellulales bacterium]
MNDQPLIDFDRRLKESTRITPVTLAIIAVNVLLWGVMLSRGVDWREPSGAALKAWGANYGPLTTGGEGWRLLANVFVHAGVLQLAFNQWALYQLGSLLERLLGHVGFALLYLVSGFGASLAGMLAQPHAVLAGSTGAVTGLIGALVAYYFRARGDVPPGVLGRLRASAFLFLAYNIGIGLYRNRLDNTGFLGGAMTGFLCGLVLAQPLSHATLRTRAARNAALTVLATLLAISAAAYTPPISDLATELKRFEDVKATAVEIYAKAKRGYEDREISADALANVIDHEILPDWKAEKNRFDELTDLSTEQTDALKKLHESMELRTKAWGLIADSLRQSSDEGIENAARQTAEADRLEQEFFQELTD